MKLFVWDFHGVLEKGNDLAVLDITNKVLEQAGYSERLNEDSAVEYYGLKWYEYFERLLPRLSSEECEALQAACFKLCENNILAAHIKVNDFAIEVLGKIEASKNEMILLSNTRQPDLLWFMDVIGIKKYFPTGKVFGVNAHERHGEKEDALRDYLDGKTFEKIIIIGDSVSDMDLKHVAGGITYYYSRPPLRPMSKTEADYFITDLREILKQL